MNELSRVPWRVVRRLTRTARFHLRKREAAQTGISFLPPNYIFFEDFNSSSVVIDVGCGHAAELASWAVRVHRCRAFAIDPTFKHREALRALEESSNGRFAHRSYAVAAADGRLTFHESDDNESGSLLGDHINMLRDRICTYEVETVTLGSLLRRLNLPSADLLKLDLEGAEYELLPSIEVAVLQLFRQLFVEFHHHCIASRSVRDTLEVVRSLRASGLRSFSLDDHNYLFYWPARARLR